MTAPARCPFCAEPVEKDALKCRACGEAIGVAPAADGKPMKDPTDPGELLGWAMKDPDWVTKVLIGAACLLGGVVIVPMFALTGYKLRIARQQLDRPGATPMPFWDDFGELIVDGLKLTLSMMLLMMVIFTLFLVVIGVAVGIDFAMTGKPGPLTLMVGMFGYLALIFGLSMGIYVVLPAIEIEYLETGSVASALHFGSLWRRITQRPGDYFMVVVVNFLCGMLGGVGALACYVGMFFTVPWSMYTAGALIGRYMAQQRIKDAALKV
jgi:hypothetical protein